MSKNNLDNYLKQTLINYGVTFTDPCNSVTYNPIEFGGNTSILTYNNDGTYTHDDGTGVTLNIDTNAITSFVVDAGNYYVGTTVEDVLQEIGDCLLCPPTADGSYVLNILSGAYTWVASTTGNTISGGVGINDTTVGTVTTVDLDIPSLPVLATIVGTEVLAVSDGTLTSKITVDDIRDKDWFTTATTVQSQDITDNIYTMGLVGINKTTPSSYIDIESTTANQLISALGTSGDYFRIQNTGQITTSHSNNIHIVDATTSITAQGERNVNIGTQGHMFFGTQGERNITIGAITGQSSTMVNDNIIIGTASAQSNSTLGSNNVLIGTNASYRADGLSSDVFVGAYSGTYSKSTGSVTAVGVNTFSNATAGTSSTALGKDAAVELDAQRRNTFLGAFTNIAKVTGTSFPITVVVGTSSITAPGLDAALIADGVTPSGDPEISVDPYTTGDYVTLQYDNGGGASWHRFLIVDITTGELQLESDTVAAFVVGGTLTVNTNNRILNSTAVGTYSNITKSNQVVLGSDGNPDLHTPGDVTEELRVASKIIQFASGELTGGQFPVTGTGVPNRSFFEATDGNLYWKGGAGTITLLGIA